MDFEARLKEQLIRDEGLELQPYEDSLGYLTIGVGRLIDKRKGGGISHDEALYLLKNDMLKHSRAILEALPWADPVTIGFVRFGALVNMHFQLGDKLWGFKRTLAHMEKGDWKEASEEMLYSKWANQTPARALRVSKQIRTNQWV